MPNNSVKSCSILVFVLVNDITRMHSFLKEQWVQLSLWHQLIRALLHCFESCNFFGIQTNIKVPWDLGAILMLVVQWLYGSVWLSWGVLLTPGGNAPRILWRSRVGLSIRGYVTVPLSHKSSHVSTRWLSRCLTIWPTSCVVVRLVLTLRSSVVCPNSYSSTSPLWIEYMLQLSCLQFCSAQGAPHGYYGYTRSFMELWSLICCYFYNSLYMFIRLFIIVVHAQMHRKLLCIFDTLV